jgi:hypothetical protein
MPCSRRSMNSSKKLSGSVSVPGLPGCWSQGATEQEAVANIQDAVREYLAVREDLLKGAVVREVEVA